MGFVRDHLQDNSKTEPKVPIASQISSEERRILYERPSLQRQRPAGLRTVLLMLLSAALGFLLALVLM